MFRNYKLTSLAFLFGIIFLNSPMNSFASPADGSLFCESVLLSGESISTSLSQKSEQNLVFYLQELLKTNVITREELEYFREELLAGRKTNFLEDSLSVDRIVGEEVIAGLLKQNIDLLFVERNIEKLIQDQNEIEVEVGTVTPVVDRNSLEFISKAGGTEELISLLKSHFSLESNVQRPDILRKIIERSKDDERLRLEISKIVFSNANWISHAELLDVLLGYANKWEIREHLLNVFMRTDAWINHVDRLIFWLKKIGEIEGRRVIGSIGLNQPIWCKNSALLKFSIETYGMYAVLLSDFSNSALSESRLKLALWYIVTPVDWRERYIDEVLAPAFLGRKIAVGERDPEWEVDDTLISQAIDLAQNASELRLIVDAGAFFKRETNLRDDLVRKVIIRNKNDFLNSDDVAYALANNVFRYTRWGGFSGITEIRTRNHLESQFEAF